MLKHRLEFRPECDEQFFAELPASPAVFALRDEQAGADPYATKTANLRRRARRLLAAGEAGSRRLNLRDRVRWLEYTETGSDFESGFLLYQLLRQEFPQSYQKRLRLRPAPLLRLILENRYPRLVVTTRLAGSRGKSQFYGPFPTPGAAEKFAGAALDFFKVRRCTEELHPDPSFPGCIYSEMKMCLAPCFAGCSDDEYAQEVSRLEQFLASGGRSLLYALAAERDRASELLQFETAAATHARFEKAQALVRELPEVVRRIDQLRALMIQPCSKRDSVALFKIERACISEAVALRINVRHMAGGAHTAPTEPAQTSRPSGPPSQSMEMRISQELAQVAAASVKSAQEGMEHLSLLKRWYYRSSKTGELFLADDKGELPMRRIVRGVARVAKGEAPQPGLDEVARDYWINRGREAELNPE